MLATHYLPSILLTHGPLAIRHIMGYLTTSVPGFSNIAPAKARRIVVGALEGKGRETAVRLEEVEGQEFGYGGVKGDVRFEKVGWGRWDARVRGQPPRSPALSPDLPSPYGMPISSGYSNIRRERVVAPSSSAEHGMDGDGDVDMDMDMDLDNEEEADRMSLDDPCSSSEAPTDIENDQLMGDDSEDVTDDEDWAAVGAAALRQHSYQGSAPLNAGSFGGRSALGPRVQHVYTGGSRSYSYAGSGGGVGAEVRTQQPVSLLNFQKRPAPTPLGRSSLMAVEDRQERDAVEALMRLGSV